MIEPHPVPLEIEVEDDVVVIEGGPGIALTLTAEAAADTSDDLLQKATVALGRRQMKQLRAAEEKKRRG